MSFPSQEQQVHGQERAVPITVFRYRITVFRYRITVFEYPDQEKRDTKFRYAMYFIFVVDLLYEHFCLLWKNNSLNNLLLHLFVISNLDNVILLPNPRFSGWCSFFCCFLSFDQGLRRFCFRFGLVCGVDVGVSLSVGSPYSH